MNLPLILRLNLLCYPILILYSMYVIVHINEYFSLGTCRSCEHYYSYWRCIWTNVPTRLLDNCMAKLPLNHNEALKHNRFPGFWKSIQCTINNLLYLYIRDMTFYSHAKLWLMIKLTSTFEMSPHIARWHVQ